jgi:hypothetical protein
MPGGLLAWLHTRLYEKRFGRNQPIVPMVAIPVSKRRHELQEWTRTELALLKLPKDPARFFFTDLHPGRVPQDEFFLSPSWYKPDEEQPMKLVGI